MVPALQPLWNHRGFILGSVKRDFQSKYRTSMLGATWTVIQPLAMIIVYTIIFSQIISAKLPGVEGGFAYSIYLCAGIITWGLFAEITSRSQNIFIESAGLLKKINFPRLCLPVTVVATALINFFIIFGLFTGFLILTGNFPGWTYLAVFPVLLCQVIFAVGLGMTLAVLNVFFRDVGQLFSVVLQFWFWLTPIVYPASILPDTAQTLMVLNPMASIMNFYQTIFVYGQIPNVFSLLPILIIGLLMCMLGVRLYRRHGGEMVDEL